MLKNYFVNKLLNKKKRLNEHVLFFNHSVFIFFESIVGRNIRHQNAVQTGNNNSTPTVNAQLPYIMLSTVDNTIHCPDASSTLVK